MLSLTACHVAVSQMCLFATFSFPLSSLEIPSDAALLLGGYCYAGIFIMQ